MKRKYQVFISSTYTDLIEERQMAVSAVLSAGHIPAGMELFKAGKKQLEVIYKWIDDSDIFLLLIGGRYGTVEEKSKLSYTELEYNYAISRGKYIIPIILSDSFIYQKASKHGKNAVIENKNRKKYNDFKEIIKKEINVLFPENIDQVKNVIEHSLNGLILDGGWVNASDADFFEYQMLENCLKAKYRINERIAELVCSGNKGISDFLNSTDEKIVRVIQNETYIDGFIRNMEIIINDDGLTADILMKTEIKYRNVKDEKVYRSNPIFPTRMQAESYKHIEFVVNDIDMVNDIRSEVVENKNNKQFCYVVKNKYPIKSLIGNVTIMHSIRYTVEISNFYHLYAVSYPCRSFHLYVRLINDNDNRYRVILGTNDFDIEKFSERTQIRDIHDSNVDISHWMLPGAGYNLLVQNICAK